MITTNTFIPGKGLLMLDPDTYKVEVFELHHGIEYDASRTVKKWITRPYALKIAIFFDLECECIDEIYKRIVIDKKKRDALFVELSESNSNQNG